MKNGITTEQIGSDSMNARGCIYMRRLSIVLYKEINPYQQMYCICLLIQSIRQYFLEVTSQKGKGEKTEHEPKKKR